MIFTEIEQKRSEGRATRAASYAKRFAAKEACSKALGTGLRRGVFWRDMGVINQRGGKPTMALTGGALARLQEITPAGMSPQIDLTLDGRISAGPGDRDHFGGAQAMSSQCAGLTICERSHVAARGGRHGAPGPAIGPARLNWNGDDGRG